ncbi:hypothetical protein [Streptomyces nigra]
MSDEELTAAMRHGELTERDRAPGSPPRPTAATLRPCSTAPDPTAAP